MLNAVKNLNHWIVGFCSAFFQYCSCNVIWRHCFVCFLHLFFFVLAAPHFRNSIAVSSFEHFRCGNKRPHSLVSINSDQSSSGSSQQLSGASSCNLPPIGATIGGPSFERCSDAAVCAPSAIQLSGLAESAATSSLRIQLSASCTGKLKYSQVNFIKVRHFN